MRRIIFIYILLFLFFSCDSKENINLETFEVIIQAGPGGTVSTNGGNYQLGDQFSVTAIANDGYILSLIHI